MNFQKENYKFFYKKSIVTGYILSVIIILGGKFMEISELINLIANVGFPVAISAYLLIRLEKQIMTLTFSINKLNTIISTKLGIVIDNEQ